MVWLVADESAQTDEANEADESVKISQWTVSNSLCSVGPQKVRNTHFLLDFDF